ncbi:MAG: hypothetical protein A2Y92_01340 [Chloroflexi bacterium RBG_13_57_8]|nr:MAG: hypothetical protein A2Y92_01340 [Chloroflexi bacterium RBG_13_57_8]
METHELLSGAYGGILRILEFTLEGLTVEDLNWQPRPDCNSIGWLVWHLTREQDSQISSFMDQEQLWIKDGWHKKWGRPADPKDAGFGMKPADLAKFKSPGARTLLAYHKAVLGRTQKFLPTLKKSDLDKVIEGTPFKPPPTMGMNLIMIMSDGISHLGQAGYVRGLREGMGWH